MITDQDEKQLDNEITLINLAGMLFEHDIVPTNADTNKRIIDCVKLLLTYWNQMHERRGE